MAPSWTAFEGTLHERPARSTVTARALFESVNAHAARLIAAHREFAVATRLGPLAQSLDQLSAVLETVKTRGNGCLVNLGYATGILSKTLFPETNEDYRRLLADNPFFSGAIRTGMPFPKTRRVVFQGNQPAAIPGWARLEVAS